MTAGSRRRPVGTVAISTLATGLGANLGFVPGFLAPVLQVDLDLSRVQVGVLVGVFYGATGVGSPVAGRIADVLAAAAVAGFGYALTNAGTNMAVLSSTAVDGVDDGPSRSPRCA